MNVRRLVKKSKKGNKEALLQLIMSKRDEYFRLAYSYTGNREDALDAMEDMIVILYEKIGQLKNEDSFYPWSKTILMNCCKSLWRNKKNLILIEEWKPIERMDNQRSNPIARTEHQIDIFQMLESVNEHQREAIILKFMHDFDYETIAEITGVPIGTVKSRVYQGLRKLNTLYGGDAHEKF